MPRRVSIAPSIGVAGLIATIALFLFPTIAPASDYSERKAITQELEQAVKSVKQVELPTHVAADSFARAQVAKYKPYKTLWSVLPIYLKKASYSESIQTKLKSAYEHYLKSGEVEPTILADLGRELHVFKSANKALFAEMSDLQAGMALALRDYKAYEKDPRKPIEEIVLTRFSTERPETLEVLLRWFYSEGFVVRLDTLSADEIEKTAETTKEAANAELTRVVLQPELKGKERDAALGFKKEFDVALERSLVRFKHIMGIARGVTFAQFKEASEHRSLQQKGVEFGASLAVAASSAWAVYHSVQKDAALGHLVNTWLPLVVAMSDKVFYGYFQQGVSAFFGQAKSYNYSADPKEVAKDYTKAFTPNRKFFLMAVYLNSLMLREALMLATHTHIDLTDWTVSFGATWTLIGGAAGSSLRGIFSKAPLQIYLERLRTALKNRPWLVVGIMTGWNGLWGIAQVGDLYNWKWHVVSSMGTTDVGIRSVMTVLSLTGLGIDFYKNRDYFKDQYKKLSRLLTGTPSPKCEVLLTVKTKPSELGL